MISTADADLLHPQPCEALGQRAKFLFTDHDLRFVIGSIPPNSIQSQFLRLQFIPPFSQERGRNSTGNCIAHGETRQVMIDHSLNQHFFARELSIIIDRNDSRINGSESG